MTNGLSDSQKRRNGHPEGCACSRPEDAGSRFVTLCTRLIEETLDHVFASRHAHGPPALVLLNSAKFVNSSIFNCNHDGQATLSRTYDPFAIPAVTTSHQFIQDSLQMRVLRTSQNFSKATAASSTAVS